MRNAIAFVLAALLASQVASLAHAGEPAKTAALRAKKLVSGVMVDDIKIDDTAENYRAVVSVSYQIVEGQAGDPDEPLQALRMTQRENYLVSVPKKDATWEKNQPVVQHMIEHLTQARDEGKAVDLYGVYEPGSDYEGLLMAVRFTPAAK